MIPLNMEYLEKCFYRAIETGANFVAVRVEMDGFPDAEVIINPTINAVDKLEYYKSVYDGALNHRFANGIRIVGFTFANSYEKIQEVLGY